MVTSIFEKQNNPVGHRFRVCGDPVSGYCAKRALYWVVSVGNPGGAGFVASGSPNPRAHAIETAPTISSIALRTSRTTTVTRGFIRSSFEGGRRFIEIFSLV